MLPGKPSEALAPIYRNCLFRSDVRAESHDHVSRELVEHVLRWKNGAVNAAMFKGQSRRLRMYVLQYGAEVEVAPAPFPNFAIVHTSLCGGTEIESDGRVLEVAEGRVAVVSPRRNVRLRWYPGTRQLIVKVPFSMLREMAGLDDGEDVPLAPGFLLPHVLATQWDLFAKSLLNVISMPDSAAMSPEWLDHLERNMALFLLAHQPPGSGDQPVRAKRPPEALPTNGARRIEAMVEYIESRMCAPISLDDLARAAGVSARTLNELCHRQRGVAPMELLRNMRLDAVRARLRVQPNESITDTALAHGFGHLGRFAQYYSDRFGELPRDTQQHALR